MVTRLEFSLGRLWPPFPGGLWMASQHHEGIQRLLLSWLGLLCAWFSTALVLDWTSGSTPTVLHPGAEAKPWVEVFSQQYCVLCGHHQRFVSSASMSCCLSYFALPGGQTLILSLYFSVTISVVKVTLFAKSKWSTENLMCCFLFKGEIWRGGCGGRKVMGRWVMLGE